MGKNVRLSHKLISVQKEGKDWVSTFDTKAGKKVNPSQSFVLPVLFVIPFCWCFSQIIRSKALVITSPAYVTADIVASGKDAVIPEAKELRDVYYPPVASVTIAYPNDAFKVRKDFGVLFLASFAYYSLTLQYFRNLSSASVI